jgi:hypothetical protein
MNRGPALAGVWMTFSLQCGEEVFLCPEVNRNQIARLYRA